MSISVNSGQLVNGVTRLEDRGPPPFPREDVMTAGRDSESVGLSPLSGRAVDVLGQ